MQMFATSVTTHIHISHCKFTWTRNLSIVLVIVMMLREMQLGGRRTGSILFADDLVFVQYCNMDRLECRLRSPSRVFIGKLNTSLTCAISCSTTTYFGRQMP
jgi:hypothetical protein